MSDTPATAEPVEDEAKAAHRAKAKSFLALYPPIKGVVSTRAGNTGGGTTEETPVQGSIKEFAGGAPMRLAIPLAVSRVGLEYAPDRKTFLIRIKSGWNEGGWHDTYLDPNTGKVVGGVFDMPFPRTDLENRLDDGSNAWEFGTGFWMWGGFKDIPKGSEKVPDWYRGEVPFVELKRGEKIGDDSGVPGYSWVNDDSGFVLKTPKFTAYSLVTIGGAVTDPANPNLVFTHMNSHVMNWASKGNGREQRTFAPSYDYARYPTDPRKGGGNGHQQPIAAVRIAGTLYFFTSYTDINIFRWDEAARVMVPVAGAAFRPDTAAARVPAPPKTEWGQGLIARTDPTGNFTADRYEVFDAGKPFALWNGYQINVDDRNGDVYFLPSATGIKDAKTGAVWKTFDVERGVLSLDNLSEFTLPTALHTATQCVQMRIHWATGDLYAIVEREGIFRLERYVGWRKDPTVKPAYSVGPVALSVRRKFEWWSEYDKDTGAPYDPKEGFMVASHGTMAVCGGNDGYAFMIEGQSQGIRVHRLSDGAYVGRYFDRAHQNSSQDDPNGISVTQTATEYRVFVMDFHGKSTLVRRIPKSSLLAALSAKKES